MAEKSRKQELIAIAVVEGKCAIALFETAELGRVGGERCSSVAVIVPVGRASNGPANEDEVGVLSCQSEVKFLVKDWIKAILLDNVSAASVGSAES